jgi:replicative DNA helicase
MQRLPPQDVEAEMSVLGAMLLGDRASIEKATEALQREDFYRDAHGRIYEAMVTLAERDEPVDIVTLKDELDRRGILDAVGGISYLIQLGEFVPTTANIAYYAKIVADKAVLRRLIEAAGEIAGLAYAQSEEVDTLTDLSERMIFNVARRRRTQGFTPLKPLLTEVFDRIDTLYHERGVTTGIDTGYTDLNYITSGFQPGDLVIIAARPSMGKCVAFDTLLDDPRTGERITIEQWVNERRSHVLHIGPCGRIAPTPVGDWIDSGIKPVFRVTTRTGRSIEVTGHHPFLTVNGWTPLHDLSIGSTIAIPRTAPVFGREATLSAERIRLLAYLIAEGGLTDSCPEWTNTDPELVANFKAIIATEFPELSIRQDRITYIAAKAYTPGVRKNLPNPLTEWLKELGLWGKRAEEKYFPDCIWSQPEESFIDFIRILFSCDATIYSMEGYPRIEFAVASERLAQDVHHALVRLGIVGKFWRKSERCWRVEITEPESVTRYQQKIGWLGEKSRRQFLETEKVRRANVGHPPREVWPLVRTAAKSLGLSLTELARKAGENVPENGWNPYTNRGLPRNRLAAYAQVLEDDSLQTLASPDLYWDEIIVIEPMGEKQVYDLTVPDGANFIAADICVHNTALTLNIGQNASLRAEKSVAVFSLEMSKESLVQRMICSEARVDAHRLRTGFLSEEDWSRLAQAVDRLWNARLFIDDSTDVSSLEMRAKCRRLRAEYGLDMVIVDYLQLMRGSSRNTDNRNNEITEIARGLKSLARELEVPVIALSQLSRSVERREDKRPMLSDLRDSGSIEAEADVVGFIYRPTYYARKEAISQEGEEKADTERGAGEYEGEEAEVIIAKQRNGPTGTVKLSFLPKFARFENLAQNREGPDF